MPPRSRSGGWPPSPSTGCGPGPRPSPRPSQGPRSSTLTPSPGAVRYPESRSRPSAWRSRCRRPPGRWASCASTMSWRGSTRTPSSATYGRSTPPPTSASPRLSPPPGLSPPPAPEPRAVRPVATAGHVDHGKSTVVHALTGTDPDRFPEEKQRGLTIDLGYAFTTLPSGEEVGFVDVPGHVRFIKNMLAGVGAVDVVMLVVAANEGWMPQSEEHLHILELLGVSFGLVCLTKADLVDDDTCELARLEVDDRLAQSAFAEAPIVVCDALSGRGLDDVRSALDGVLGAAPRPIDRDRPRLWVDRVFAAKGAGTIVTGTLVRGAPRGDETGEGSARAERARIRAIETAHQKLDVAAPGARVALNLAGPGIDRNSLRRGDAVVRPGQWELTDVIDVELGALPGNDFRNRASL